MNARRWKRYPRYRDSGVEWLGDVPSHWQVRPFKHCVTQVAEPASGAAADLPFLGLEHIESWTGRLASSTEDLQESTGDAGIRFAQGDLLFSKLRPYLAKAVVAVGSGRCTGELLVLKPTQLHARYGLYLLLSNGFIEHVDGSTYGTKMPRANWSFIGASHVPLPDEDEQRTIAAFLDRETARIDALIAKKEDLIRLLEEKRASLVTQVVTRGLSPDAPTVDSGIPAIGAVPAHWRVLRNKNILRAVQDPSPDGSEELLTVSHITGVTPRTEKDVTMFLAESNVGYPRVAPGDLVINTMWAWMGALGVSRHHGIVSPAYGVYRFTDAEVLPEYYDAFYRTPAYVTEMTRFSTGVWSSRLRIYPDVFLSLRVVVPPIDEQRAILDHIKAATGDTDAVLDRLATSVALLREQRQALITAAVTGQIDVREDAPA
jgi:type I restriction enzyme S subunit